MSNDLMQKIVIKGKPKGKGRPRFKVMKQGKKTIAWAYTDSNTKKYEGEIKTELKKLYPSPIDNPVLVIMEAIFPVPQKFLKTKDLDPDELFNTAKPDIDNIIKIVFDAMNEVVVQDDSQIVGVMAYKKFGLEPRLEVSILKDDHKILIQ